MQIGNFDKRPGVMDRRHMRRPAQRNRLAIADPAVQFGLKVWLVKAIAGIPAKWADFLRTRPVQKQILVTIDKFCADIHPRIAANALRQADGLENPHCLVIEMHRARQRVDRVLAFENQHIDAISPKDIGKRGACRPKAHNHHLVIRLLRSLCSCHPKSTG